MAVAVRTEVFEGPFDLLLHLILREEVDLYEVSLSAIVDAYVAEVERMEALDLEVTTEFLLIAAILVELKTKRLLPDEGEVDLEDELGLWEQRDLLLARLVECKTFKDASVVLQARMLDASRSFPRTAGPEERLLELRPDLLAGVTPDDLRRAFFTATAPKPEPRVSLEHVSVASVTVDEALAEVVDELHRVGSLTFRELTRSLVERVEVVVRFLAVLELYKQGLVELDQLRSFGEIRISWRAGTHRPAAADLALADAYEG